MSGEPQHTGAIEDPFISSFFRGALAISLAVAFVALPLNRGVIGRGKGHAVVHELHHA